MKPYKLNVHVTVLFVQQGSSAISKPIRIKYAETEENRTHVSRVITKSSTVSSVKQNNSISVSNVIKVLKLCLTVQFAPLLIIASTETKLPPTVWRVTLLIYTHAQNVIRTLISSIANVNSTKLSRRALL